MSSDDAISTPTRDISQVNQSLKTIQEAGAQALVKNSDMPQGNSGSTAAWI